MWCVGGAEAAEDRGGSEAAQRVDGWNGGPREHVARAPEEAEEQEEGGHYGRPVRRDGS